ncbi:hypothetical protein [Lacticaseibacillus sp. N501-2]|uniref:hypothetical protein n=1 Tax=Lacticaseibacillus salsurae TaxID=3367729 RepID=UPI0038B30192
MIDLDLDDIGFICHKKYLTIIDEASVLRGNGLGNPCCYLLLTIKIQVVGDSSEVDVDGGTDIDGPVDTTKPESEHTALPDTNNWWSGWLPGLGSPGPWLMWLGFALMGFMLGVLVGYKYLREGERRD